VFVISDFQDEGYDRSLRMLRRRHDLILVDVRDRREAALPAMGLVELIESETGRRIVVDTSSARWRRSFEDLTRAAIAARERRLRQLKVDCIAVETGASFVDPLVRFFRTREARRR